MWRWVHWESSIWTIDGRLLLSNEPCRSCLATRSIPQAFHTHPRIAQMTPDPVPRATHGIVWLPRSDRFQITCERNVWRLSTSQCTIEQALFGKQALSRTALFDRPSAMTSTDSGDIKAGVASSEVKLWPPPPKKNKREVKCQLER